MKLNYKRTFFIGLAFMSISAFWQMYDNIIPLILQNTFNLGETLIGGIMAIDNVLALFLLPLFGSLSDKADTRLGKRTPFIVGGTILAVIFMMLIPYSDKIVSFPLFFISLGIVLLAMGTYRSPAVALMPDLTPKPLRSKANSIINLMGAAGAIFTLIVIQQFLPKGDHPDYSVVFIAIAALMIIAIIMLLITIQEKKLAKKVLEIDGELDDKTTRETSAKQAMPKEVRKSLIFLFASIFLWFTAYNAVTTAFSRYATKVWGMEGGSFASFLIVAMGAAIIAFIPIGIISSHIGRKKTIIAGIIMMSVSYFAGFLFVEYSPLINIVFVFTGFGWAAINVNSYPMVVEMASSADTGKYTGLYYIFSMTAQTITPILSGALLQYVSYRTLFPYALVFSLASLGTMIFVKHGDSKPHKKEDALENFDFED